MNKRIKFCGSTFNRQIELIGDVEKITWFQCFEKGQGSDIEIYDTVLANDLEETYESIIMYNITIPHTTII